MSQASQPWHERAACRGEDPELFYDGESPASRKRAIAVCRSCMVLQACLRTAMREEEDLAGTVSQNRRLRFGIRGGLTPTDRWRMFKAEREQAAAEDEAAALVLTAPF